MSKLEKMATRIAAEMVSHYILGGATHLDLDFIAKNACDLAYKISEEVSQHKASGDNSSEKKLNKAIELAIEKRMEKTKTEPRPPHYP